MSTDETQKTALEQRTEEEEPLIMPTEAQNKILSSRRVPSDLEEEQMQLMHDIRVG